MTACIIQPFYSMDYERSEELLQWELDALEKCTSPQILRFIISRLSGISCSLLILSAYLFLITFDCFRTALEFALSMLLILSDTSSMDSVSGFVLVFGFINFSTFRRID